MAAVIGNASGDAQSTAPGYADALQRAREIASKIQPENPGPMGDYSNKRPLEDSGEHSDEPGAKKLASQNDLSLLGSMQQQQQLGAVGGRVPIAENIHLPDKLVGLVIGKGGENITKLQAQTGCRIQIAQECAENNERPCTLTGTPEQIATCRAILQDIIKNANLGGNMNNNVAGIEEMSGNGAQTVIQLMIPPDKCGLIIGKGGDTIKSLQQNIGVKMMLIQDTTQNTGLDKPLRISGDPMKVQQAKQAVEQLMAQRDAQIAAGRQSGGGGGMGGMNRNFEQHHSGGGGGGMGQPNRVSIPVPKPAVGVVIGKGGEMITRIQNETRTRVQFKQEEEDPNVGHRMCTISGTPEGVQEAIARVNELVQSVQEHDHGGHVGGGIGARSGGFGQWDNPAMNHGRSAPGVNTVEFNVPANKTGLVIGKGGETIKNINLQSQAHVEIQRNPPPGSDPNFKTFIIKGSPDQIAHAQQLIQEKVDGGPGRGGPMRHNMGPPGMGHPGPMHGPPGGGPPGGFVPPPQGGFGGPPPGPGFGGPPQVPPAPAQPPHPPFPGQQPWAAPGQFQWPGAPGAPQPNGAAPPDLHKPADANAAAFASYYQYYQSQGQQPAQAAASAAQAAAQFPPAAAAAPAAVPAAQPDYTKAWEEYYKKQAEAAAAAAAAGNPAAAAAAPAVAPAAAPAATSQTDYSAAWAEYYRQYSQYYQQAQAGQYPAASAAPGP